MAIHFCASDWLWPQVRLFVITGMLRDISKSHAARGPSKKDHAVPAGPKIDDKPLKRLSLADALGNMPNNENSANLVIEADISQSAEDLRCANLKPVAEDDNGNAGTEDSTHLIMLAVPADGPSSVRRRFMSAASDANADISAAPPGKTKPGVLHSHVRATDS